MTSGLFREELIYKMKPFKTLYKGKWLSIIRPKSEDLYEVLHENNGIIVMPIIITPGGIYSIIRKEFCPPYQMRSPEYNHYYTVISGTIDDVNEPPKECMLRELEEEAGVKPIDYDILWEKHEMPMYKGSDRRSSNYIIRVKKFELHDEQPDGTKGEALSKSLAVNFNDLPSIIEKPNCDYLLYSMYYITKSILKL
jgi:hypothetical protein